MSSIRPAGAACSLSQSRRRSCKLPGSAQSAQPCSRRQAQCAPALQSARRRVWQPAAATAGAAAAGDAIANSAEVRSWCGCCRRRCCRPCCRYCSRRLCPCAQLPPMLATVQAAAAVEGFCVSHDVPQGRLVIRPVQPLDVSPASVRMHGHPSRPWLPLAAVLDLRRCIRTSPLKLPPPSVCPIVPCLCRCS